MSNSLTEIAQQLQRTTHKTRAVAEKTSDVKVQLIYAFNGTGKTRLSREFKDLITPNNTDEEIADIDQAELAQKNILYYSILSRRNV